MSIKSPHDSYDTALSQLMHIFQMLCKKQPTCVSHPQALLLSLKCISQLRGPDHHDLVLQAGHASTKQASVAATATRADLLLHKSPLTDT